VFIAANSDNLPIRVYKQKLQACGKAGKPALVAAAKKLLTICRECVRNGREFDSDYAEQETGRRGQDTGFPSSNCGGGGGGSWQ